MSLSSASKKRACSHNIFYNKKAQVFQCGAKVLTGIHLATRRLFFPDFHFQTAFQRYNGKSAIATSSSSSSSPASRKPVRFLPIWIVKKRLSAAATTSVSTSTQTSLSSSSSTPSSAPSSSTGSSSCSANAGSVLDDQVEEMVKICNQKYSVFEIFLATSGASPMNPRTDELKPKVAHWSDCTKELVKFLHRKGWIPFRSQVVVGSMECCVATKIDLLCMDARAQTYIVIELKVGYDYGKCGSDVMMLAPFEKLDARIDHQQQIQLLGNILLFEKSFTSVKSEEIDGCILQFKIMGSGKNYSQAASTCLELKEIPLDPRFKALKQQMWEAMIGKPKAQKRKTSKY